MADMGRQQYLVFGFAFVQKFAVGKRSRFEARVNHDIIELIIQAFKLTVWHAERPVLSIIRRAIRDEFRLIRERVDVFFELGQ